MNKLTIKQNTGLTEQNVPGSVIEELVDISNTTNDMELEGSVSIKSTDGVYQDDINYLNTKFPNFHVNASKLYIKFADETVKSKLLESIGDGHGITLADATSVQDNTFFVGSTFKNTNITSFNELKYFTNVTSIRGPFFSGCTSLVSIDFSNIKYIINGASGLAMASCTSLVNLGNFKPISLGQYNFMHLNGGFNGCTSLESVNLTEIQCLANNTFSGCTNLKYISGGQQNFALSTLEYIGEQPFKNCNIQDLTELNCPLLKGTVSNSQNQLKVAAFSNIKCLTKVTNLGLITHINNAESWANGVFEGCSNLTEVTLPASLVSIGKGAFRNCNSITKLTCLATTPPTINNDQGFIPTTAQVYVPAASVSAYQSASVWSDYTINAITE